jgi:hypothetical protein
MFAVPGGMPGYQVVGWLPVTMPVVVDGSGTFGMAQVQSQMDMAQGQNQMQGNISEALPLNCDPKPEASHQNIFQGNRNSQAVSFNVAKGPREKLPKTRKTPSHDAGKEAFCGIIKPSSATEVQREASQHQVDDEKNSMGPLWKTKMCMFAPHGLCSRGDTCRFAHNKSELRQAPDFSKTSICPRLLHGEGCDIPNCPYAHRGEELREINGMLKTKMCRFYTQMGRCVLGSRCRFAHGETELGTVSPVPSKPQRSEENDDLVQIYKQQFDSESSDSEIDSDRSIDDESNWIPNHSSTSCREGTATPTRTVSPTEHANFTERIPEVSPTKHANFTERIPEMNPENDNERRMPQMWNWKYSANSWMNQSSVDRQAPKSMTTNPLVKPIGKVDNAEHLDNTEGKGDRLINTENACMSGTDFYGMTPDNTPPYTPRMWTSPPEMVHFAQSAVCEDDSNPPTPDPLMAWKRQQEASLALSAQYGVPPGVWDDKDCSEAQSELKSQTKVAFELSEESFPQLSRETLAEGTRVGAKQKTEKPIHS